MKDRRLIKRTIDTIKVGERHRKDLGDIPSLAVSIAKVGLLNPITVTSEGLLIAGHRRLEACKHLGWRLIQCVVADDLESAIARLTAERDENTERKEMSIAEKLSLAAALAELEIPKAKQRQSDAGKAYGKGIASPPEGVSYPPAKTRRHREVDDIVAPVVGWSGTTYGRVKAVTRAMEDPSLTQQQREVAKQAFADMEATGNVSGNYNKVREAIRPTPHLSKKSTSIVAKEQRYVFNKNLPEMSGMMMLMDRIEKLDPEITIDEIEQWITSLSKTRRSIEQIIKRLKEFKNGAQVTSA
jgi:ParB family chromosome partitioning protein